MSSIALSAAESNRDIGNSHTSLPRSRSPSAPRSSPPPQAPVASDSRLSGSNGDHSAETPGAQNDSEAETVVLTRTPAKNRAAANDALAVNRERGDADKAGGEGSPSIATTPRADASRRGSAAVAARDIEGAAQKNGRAGAVDDVPAASNGRRRSSQGIKSNSGDSVPSSALRSPSPNSERNNVEPSSRKRKHLGDNRASSGEPPRQKLKANTQGSQNTLTLHERRGLPPPQGNRSHKRAASTQSNSANDQSRKERELSAVVLPSQERRAWDSDASSISDDAESHPYLKRAPLRSATSPVRNMPPNLKKKVDRFGVSVFARMCEKGDLESAKIALEHHPSAIDEPDYAKNTPLQKACLEGHVDVVKFLISTGQCNINNANSSFDTPLIDAVENGHLEVVKLLLEAGADPHLQNNKGSKPVDVLEDDLTEAKRIRSILNKAMQQSSSVRKDEAAREPGSARAASQQNSPSLPRSPPNTAVLFGRQAKLPNSILHMESTIESLRNKAAEGDQVAVHELLVRGVRPDNACGVAAARGGHEFILNLFLDADLDIDPDPVKHDFETPMLAAIGRGHIHIVDLLLKQDGFDPTRLSRHGKTYYVLAEERHGPNWQKERDMLKEAYDYYIQHRKSLKKKHAAGATSASDHPKRRSSPLRKESNGKEKAHVAAQTGNRSASGSSKHDGANERKRKLDRSESEAKAANISPRTAKISDGEHITEKSEAPERRRKLVSAKDLPTQDRRSRVKSEPFSSEDGKSERPKYSESPRSSRRPTPEPASTKSKAVERGSKLATETHSKKKATDAETDSTTTRAAAMHQLSSVNKKPRLEDEARPQREKGDQTKSLRGKGESERSEKDKLERKKLIEEKRGEEKLQKERLDREKKELERLEVEQREQERRDQEKRDEEKRERQKREKEKRELEEREKEKREQEKRELERREQEKREQREKEEEKREQERLERQRLEEERLAREEAEKQKLEQQRLEEQLAEQRRLEEERLEQEKIERQRQEDERLEQERLAREQRENERRTWLSTLPPALKLAMELGPRMPRFGKGKAIGLNRHFLPIKVTRLVELDRACDPDKSQSLWMLNFQAAAILGHHDMDLSQYPSWERRPVTTEHRTHYLRTYDIYKLALDRRMPQYDEPEWDGEWFIRQGVEGKRMFMQMQPLFWIPFDNFIEAVPDYPHLKDLHMKTDTNTFMDMVEDSVYGTVRRSYAESMRRHGGDTWKVSDEEMACTPKPMAYINGRPAVTNGC